MEKTQPSGHDTIRIASMKEPENWAPTERIRVVRFRGVKGDPDFRIQRLWRTIGTSGPGNLKWLNVEEVELADLDELAAATKMNSIIEFERPERQ